MYCFSSVIDFRFLSFVLCLLQDWQDIVSLYETDNVYLGEYKMKTIESNTPIKKKKKDTKAMTCKSGNYNVLLCFPYYYYFFFT